MSFKKPRSRLFLSFKGRIATPRWDRTFSYITQTAQKYCSGTYNENIIIKQRDTAHNTGMKAGLRCARLLLNTILRVLLVDLDV